MARPITGTVRTLPSGTQQAMVRDGAGRRRYFDLECQKDERQARAADMSRWAGAIRDRVAPDIFDKLMVKAASATTLKALDAVRKAIEACANGAVEAKDPKPTIPTFKTFAQQWTSGALHKLYSAHVKSKLTAEDDEERFKRYVYDPVGDVPLDEFTLDHAMLVMAGIPEARATATKRQIAQLMHRLLGYAVFPARHIAVNPLPKGFLPRVECKKAEEFLYPDEEARLLACAGDGEHEGVPLNDRMLYGFATREGMRQEEMERLTWGEIDLKRGIVRQDENKTKDASKWAMNPSVTAALTIWHDHFRPKAKRTDLVFADDDGWLYTSTRWAARLRRHMKLAGITRPELYLTTATRMNMRFHDLRATFCTCSFANGRSEAWVMQRTKHKSSTMLARYTRSMNMWAEADLGDLHPMHLAIPELAAHVKTPPSNAKHVTPESRTDSRTDGRDGALRVPRVSKASGNTQSPINEGDLVAFKIRCPYGREGSSPSFGTRGNDASRASLRVSIAACVPRAARRTCQSVPKP